jgi:hypothetical protein
VLTGRVFTLREWVWEYDRQQTDELRWAPDWELDRRIPAAIKGAMLAMVKTFPCTPPARIGVGLEPNTKTEEYIENVADSSLVAPKASPSLWELVVAYPDLQSLVRCWPALPLAMRQGILSIASAQSSNHAMKSER